MASPSFSFLFSRPSPQDTSFLTIGIRTAKATILATGTISREETPGCSGWEGPWQVLPRHRPVHVLLYLSDPCDAQIQAATHTHTHAHACPRSSRIIHGKHMGVPFSLLQPEAKGLGVCVKSLADLHCGFRRGTQGGLLRPISAGRTDFREPKHLKTPIPADPTAKPFLANP